LSSSASTVSRGALNRLSPLRLPVSPRPHCLIYSEGIGVGKALYSHVIVMVFALSRYLGLLGRDRLGELQALASCALVAVVSSVFTRREA
jgi:hypothetical protein